MKYPALLLCLIFVAWLLNREIRRRPSMSRALWIPTLMVLMLGSRPISQWISGTPRAFTAGTSFLDEAFFACILAASFFIASARGVKWGRFLAANYPLILLYTFFALSVIWSGDPVASAKRICKDFALLFVIAVILSEKEPSEALRAVFIRSACIWFPLSIVFNHYFPVFAREFGPEGAMMLSGVTGQKNALGEMVFIFCAILLWDCLEARAALSRKSFRNQPWDQLALFLMGIVLLIQSESKTALVSLFVCAAFIFSSGWRPPKMLTRLAYYVVLSSPFLLYFTKVFGDAIQPIVEALGRDMTFTGRTNIWAHITLDTVNPIFGYGYWTFWGGPRGRAISDSINWTIPTAHCGYLDIYLDGGICGLLVLFIVLLVYGNRLLKFSANNRFQMTRLGILAGAIVYNLAESSFVRMGLLWFAVLLVIVDFPKMKWPAKVVQHVRSGNTVARHRQTVPASARRISVR